MSLKSNFVHQTNFECLTGCDDIIRQHKAACLRVTSLLACQDLLWVGTSAGVILTMPLPHVSAQTTKISSTLQVTGRSKCELDTLSHFSRWWWPVKLLWMNERKWQFSLYETYAFVMKILKSHMLGNRKVCWLKND